jgi:hypothetical protein
MPFNDPHLSNEILEWISTTSFDELSNDQQNKVLAVMTVDAYNELHLTHSLLIQQTELPELSKNHLDHLLLAFDQHHHQPVSASLLSTNWFWKIASICLLCSTLTLTYLHSTVRVNSQEIIVKHDTIYQTPYQHVSSSPSPETTPTLAPQPRINGPKKSSIVSVRKNINRSRQISSADNKVPTTDISRNELALPVYASTRFHDVCNQSKGNRMKDDSLAQNFNYVSL